MSRKEIFYVIGLIIVTIILSYFLGIDLPNLIRFILRI
jgi:hypothetical protein